MNQVTTEYSACLFGCEPSDIHVVTGCDRLHGIPGKFEVVKCLNCGLMRTNPRPVKESISFYYPGEYGPHKKIDEIPQATNNIRRKIRSTGIGKLLINISRGNEDFIPELPSGSNVLELGFGNASFLQKLKGKNWNLFGIETNEELVSFAKEEYGIDTFCGNLEDAKYPDKYFDAVYGWHVMEHLYDPLQTAKEVFRVLKKGGYFIMGMPNAASWEFRIFKSYWYALDLPRHLFHFTPETIEMILKKAGFRSVSVEHQESITNVIMSSFYFFETIITRSKPLGFRDSAKRSFLLRVLTRPFALMMGKISKSGRMLVIAKK